MSMNRYPKSLTRHLSVIAPAKINMHLEVLGLRSDGFHELAMMMQSIDLADRIILTATKNTEIHLSCDDSNLSLGEDNLIIRAARLLREQSGFKGNGATIHLEKKIPIGAGLAGGSSDAAATLKGLNELWGLQLSREELCELSAELGSDVPFCLMGGSQLCFGRGEKLEPTLMKNSSMAVLLVKDSSVSVSTPWAYGRFRDLYGKNYLSGENEFEKRRQALRSRDWLRSLNEGNSQPLRNDLQQVVSAEVSSVRKSLQLLAELPACITAAMSGSGPSCFALFPSLELAKSAIEQNGEKFLAAGLNSWCCSLISYGAKLDK